MTRKTHQNKLLINWRSLYKHLDYFFFHKKVGESCRTKTPQRLVYVPKDPQLGTLKTPSPTKDKWVLKMIIQYYTLIGRSKFRSIY